MYFANVLQNEILYNFFLFLGTHVRACLVSKANVCAFVSKPPLLTKPDAAVLPATGQGDI